jgi:hypothetical protein
MIATDEGTTVLDLLSGILRPVLDRKFAKIVKRIDSSEVGNE